jgi:hypothetical protein
MFLSSGKGFSRDELPTALDTGIHRHRGGARPAAHFALKC